VGATFVCIGTLASRATWLAAVAMAIAGFAVLFSGTVSSVLTAATTSLLLAFILPVTLRAPVSSIPDRLAGWAMAAAASFVAVTVLWPAPSHYPLRAPVVDACRALAARMRSAVANLLGGESASSAPEHEEAVARWTGDHLDAARRLQGLLAERALEAAKQSALATSFR
jgi:uncharacterized membrane protein YccC